LNRNLKNEESISINVDNHFNVMSTIGKKVGSEYNGARGARIRMTGL
jgi:hypothetical protein